MKINLQEYCKDISNYQRFPTREVMVGDIAIGKDNPIRIQSMTTTDTMDTKGTIAQSIRMIDAGSKLLELLLLVLKRQKTLK